ncbi:MAG: Rne/Rng family ribonuclease [Pleurocapsa sp.]
MPKQIIIAEQHHIAAVFWEEQIQELIVATGNQQVSDIYLGSVENVIPGIDAAFVNIGDAERNGFIHVTDLGPLRLKKSAAAITELLLPQQKALVQVMKEPTGNKGPRLTGNITLPGRYLVLMPYGKGVKLSRRIADENERSRLRALAILIKPPGMGILVRTEADGKAEEAIMEDLEFLQKQWESIQYQANHAKPPALLNRDDDFIQRVLRDVYSAEVNTIVVDSPAGVKRIKQHLINWSAGRSPQGVFIDYHRESQQILEYYRVNAAIREALKPRVELPSGGYIIIEPTEALTVIDVNSGSFTRSATARETVLWTNTEAATEIARQLRLRNIGGVIVVDFIDMDSHRDRLKLLEHFNNTLKADKARPQIAQLSELGLVELTRKRQGKNIYELFGQTCPTCGGLGQLAHLPGKSEGERLESPPINPPAAIREPVATPRTVIPSPGDKGTTRDWVKPAPSQRDRTEPALEPTADLTYDRDTYPGELLNHPNYQEQGGGINGSRRRRRRRSDLLIKDDIDETETTESNSRNLDRESDRYNGDDRKSRNQPRSLKRDEGNLEKVSVEMTDLEQEMYALMGISPLVHSEQKFKDSKSILVYVKKPGETLVIEDNSPDSRSDTIEESEPEKNLETEPKAADVATEISTSIESEPSTEVTTSEPEEEEETSTVRRRRRRRSSATPEVSV